MTEHRFAEILQAVAAGLRARKVKAVLMGGAALPVYGVERMTLDLDFLLAEEALPEFSTVVEAAGYRLVLRTAQFAKFRHADEDALDLDTVFVDATTAEKAWREADDQHVGDAVFRCASLPTMLATKLHAIKHNEARRGARDFEDVLDLLAANALDATAAAFRDLCLKYGDKLIYQRILDALGKRQ